ncbi:hypothetical protein FRC03_000389 [Tulasnella sp. 419]|nr:hypothetical protein FRC03_000389 [Tulasnella sp. 419]
MFTKGNSSSRSHPTSARRSPSLSPDSVAVTPVSISPIDLLPDELVYDIFEHLLKLYQYSPSLRFRCPSILSNVSRRWHSLALNLPSIWAPILISLNPRAHVLESDIMTRLSRSKSYPIDVEIILFDVDASIISNPNRSGDIFRKDSWSDGQISAILGSLRAITPSNVTDRMRRLVVKAYSSTKPTGLQALENQVLTFFLDQLSSHSQRFSSLTELVLDGVLAVNFSPVIQRSPRLRSLTLFNTLLDSGDFGDMSLVDGLERKEFQHLYISIQCWAILEGRRMQDDLSAFCMLTTLYIGGSDLVDIANISDIPSSSQPLLMQRLTELRVIYQKKHIVAHILGSIIAPSLKKLELWTRDEYRPFWLIDEDPSFFHADATFPELTHIVASASDRNECLGVLFQLADKAPNVSHLSIMPHDWLADISFLGHPEGESCDPLFPRLEVLTIEGHVFCFAPRLRRILESRLVARPSMWNMRQVNLPWSSIREASQQDSEESPAEYTEALNWLLSHVEVTAFNTEDGARIGRREGNKLLKRLGCDFLTILTDIRHTDTRDIMHSDAIFTFCPVKIRS